MKKKDIKKTKEFLYQYIADNIEDKELFESFLEGSKGANEILHQQIKDKDKLITYQAKRIAELLEQNEKLRRELERIDSERCRHLIMHK